MKKENAEKIGILALQLGGWLNGRLIDILDDCPEKEVRDMKLKFGRIMADLLTEIMNPIYREYPDLKPIELGDLIRSIPQFISIKRMEPFVFLSEIKTPSKKEARPPITQHAP